MTNQLFTDLKLNSVEDLKRACAAIKGNDFSITAKVTCFNEKGLPQAVIINLPDEIKREIQMYIACSLVDSCHFYEELCQAEVG